jgi:hypothetical protein
MYCRPAKPISVTLLALGIYYVSQFRLTVRQSALLGACLVAFAGLFADEMMFWFLPFGALWCLWGHWRSRNVWLARLAVPLSYPVGVIVLQALYSSFGMYGPRKMSASGLVVFKLALDGDVWALSLRSAVRKLLVFVGTSHPSELAIYLGVGAFAASGAVLALSKSEERASHFGLLAVSGFLSFSVWGQIIHTFHGIPSLQGGAAAGGTYDYMSLAYYYHAPLCIPGVLCMAAIWRANRRAWPFWLPLCALIVSWNLPLFVNLNRVVQLAHLGRYSSDSILKPLRSGVAGMVNLTRDSEVEREFIETSKRLFGDNWRDTNMYRDFRIFRKTPYVGNYAMQTCRVFLQNCPLTFFLDDGPLVRDKQRKTDLIAIAANLEKYRALHGQYPAEGDNQWIFSVDPEWRNPVDPLNTGQPFWAGAYSYGLRGWRHGCPEQLKGQFYLIGTILEVGEGNVASDCDGNTVPWGLHVWTMEAPARETLSVFADN